VSIVASAISNMTTPAPNHIHRIGSFAATTAA